MTTVGSGGEELRIRLGQEFRVLYIARFAEAVYVVHALEKKSQKTAGRDVEIAAKRLAELKRLRERGKK